MQKQPIPIYCDGACEPNPGHSGVGIVYNENEFWFGLHEERGTNNRAELMGIHHSLMMAEENGGKHIIYSDSQYSINSITLWAQRWSQHNWTSKKKAIKNADIIEPAYELYMEIKDRVKVKWVRGHNNNFWNEVADRLASRAYIAQEEDLILILDQDKKQEIMQEAKRPSQTSKSKRKAKRKLIIERVVAEKSEDEGPRVRILSGSKSKSNIGFSVIPPWRA